MGKWLKNHQRGRKKAVSSDGSPVMASSFGGDPAKILEAEERAYQHRRDDQANDAIDRLKRQAKTRRHSR